MAASLFFTANVPDALSGKRDKRGQGQLLTLTPFTVDINVTAGGEPSYNSFFAC